jgi:hypothetical protein
MCENRESVKRACVLKRGSSGNQLIDSNFAFQQEKYAAYEAFDAISTKLI